MSDVVTTTNIKTFLLSSAIIFYVMLFISFVLYPIAYDTSMNFDQFGRMSINGISNLGSTSAFVCMLFVEALLYFGLFIVFLRKHTSIAMFGMVIAIGFVLTAIPMLYSSAHNMGIDIIQWFIPLLAIDIAVSMKINKWYVFAALIAIAFILDIVSIAINTGDWITYINVYMYVLITIVLVMAIFPEKYS